MRAAVSESARRSGRSRADAPHEPDFAATRSSMAAALGSTWARTLRHEATASPAGCTAPSRGRSGARTAATNSIRPPDPTTTRSWASGALRAAARSRRLAVSRCGDWSWSSVRAQSSRARATSPWPRPSSHASPRPTERPERPRELAVKVDRCAAETAAAPDRARRPPVDSGRLVSTSSGNREGRGRLVVHVGERESGLVVAQLDRRNGAPAPERARSGHV